MPMAPCIPANALLTSAATPMPPTQLRLPPAPHRPPAVGLQHDHPRPPPPPAPLPLPSSAPLQALPTQSGTRVSSPAGPHAPSTPALLPCSTSPDPPCDTCAHLQLCCMD